MLHIYNCTLKKKQLHSKIVNLTQFKKNLLIKFKKKILIKFKKKKLIKYLFTHVNEEIEIVY